MQKIEKEKMPKQLKSNIQYLIISIVLLVITTASIVLGFIIEPPISYLDNDVQSGDKAKIDIIVEPYLFAEQIDDPEGGKFYLTMDANNYLYVIYAEDDTFDQISSKAPTDENPITIKGTSYEIKDSIKDIAVEVYNEDFDDSITDDNFYEYFGYYYLEVNDEESSYNIYLFILGGISLIASIILSSIYFERKRRTNKTLDTISESKLNTILREIKDKKEYEHLKIYLTENSLVNMTFGLDIIDYKDIIWLYRFDFQDKSPNNRIIVIYTKDRERHELTGFKKDNKSFEEIFEYLVKNTKDIKVGYNKEIRNDIKIHYNIKD